MGVNVIVRAVLVRSMFACHGLLAIWRLFTVTGDTRAWYISAALGGLALEATFTLCKKKGHEWKWFCPSVFFYLLSVVPAIWFLELHELKKRITLRENATLFNALFNTSEVGLQASIGTFRLEIPVWLTSDQWLRTIEQILLLFLIVGRWMLPKGKLTHDQLSQLLLVYIGTAADIVEFFDAFKEDRVRYDPLLCQIILSIWSWSLLQFTMVLTATKARKDQSGVFSRPASDHQDTCCTPDVYGIVISIFMQDAPFLTLRLLLIFKYKVVSYTNMFFTCKNTLVCLLLIYRLLVVQIDKRQERRKLNKEYVHMSESNSGVKLMHTYNDPYVNLQMNNHYRSPMSTRSPSTQLSQTVGYSPVPVPGIPQEPEYEDIPVNYTIKRHISDEETDDTPKYVGKRLLSDPP